MHRIISSLASSGLLLISAAAIAQAADDQPEPAPEPSAVESGTVEDEAAASDPANSESEISEAQRDEWESQLQVAAEEACARAYNCATEDVPRLVRRTIKRDQVCEVYQNDSRTGREATIDQECVSASLDYLRCVRSSSCDDLTGSGARACVGEAEQVEQECNDE